MWIYLSGLFYALVNSVATFLDVGVLKDNSIRYWDGHHFSRVYLPTSRKVAVITEFVIDDVDWVDTYHLRVTNANLGVPMTMARAMAVMGVTGVPEKVLVTKISSAGVATTTHRAPYDLPVW